MIGLEIGLVRRRRPRQATSSVGFGAIVGRSTLGCFIARTTCSMGGVRGVVDAGSDCILLRDVFACLMFLCSDCFLSLYGRQSGKWRGKVVCRKATPVSRICRQVSGFVGRYKYYCK